METKQIEKAYVFRLYPEERQETLISKAIGCARFVYNYFLAKRRKKHPERRLADSRSLKIMNRRNCGDSLWSSGKTSLRKAVNDESGTSGWSHRNLVTSVMRGSMAAVIPFKLRIKSVATATKRLRPTQPSPHLGC